MKRIDTRAESLRLMRYGAFWLIAPRHVRLDVQADDIRASTIRECSLALSCGKRERLDVLRGAIGVRDGHSLSLALACGKRERVARYSLRRPTLGEMFLSSFD